MFLVNFIVKIISIALVAMVGLCFLGSKVSSVWFPYNSLLSLFFPYFYIGLFLWGVVVAFIRWQLLISIVLMLALCYSGFSNFFVFPKFDGVAEKSKLRVLSWNVANFSYKQKHENKQATNEAFLDIIQKIDPDVICLQEVYIDKKHNWIDKLVYKEGFKYKQYGQVKEYVGNVYRGSVIFSKYPIRNRPPLSLSLRNEIVNVTIANPYNEKMPVHIFSIHLQSNLINSAIIGDIKNITKQQKEAVDAAVTFSDRLASNSRIRYNQIDEVLAASANLQGGIIICADLNDVAGSYNYVKMKGDFLDAFNEHGSGFRFTFPQGFASVGIDFIFSNMQIPPKAYKQLDADFSDHLPHYADF